MNATREIIAKENEKKYKWVSSVQCIHKYSQTLSANVNKFKWARDLRIFEMCVVQLQAPFGNSNNNTTAAMTKKNVFYVEIFFPR